jgi:hypothetical protein
MEKTVKKLLEEASFLMGQAKVALYEAESQTLSSEEIVAINELWWVLEDAHNKLAKLI